MLMKKLEPLTKFIDYILEYVAIAGLIISTSLAIVAVFMRYFFGYSSGLVEEICRYSIIYGVFAYIGPLIKKNEHLKMNMLSDAMTGKVKVYNNLLISIVMFLAFIYLFWSGINWYISLLNMQLMTMSGLMLMAVPVFSVPVGMFLGCFYSLLQILNDFSQLNRLPQDNLHSENL